tara:strand:+ start:264 stop:818 length:555 start_codon:yes stop_codon:yes gene_type:complete
MWIKKDVLNQKHFEHMKNIVTDNRFPWYSMDSTAAHFRTVEYDQSFSHVLYCPEHSSDYFNMFYGTMWGGMASIGIDLNEILRMRLGLIPRTELSHMHYPHVDFSYDHQTALFCLSGNSGVTTFYNELDQGEYHSWKRDPNTLTILNRVAPEENQMIVFDGHRYHCSSTPTTDVPRIMLNINYI